MAQLNEITGTFTLSDGREVHFRIHEDYGYSQWGSGDAGLTVDALNAMIDGLRDAEVEVGGTGDEPEPGPCANCGDTIEPDDGGAAWYHADTGARFCDGDDDRSRSWAECADAAEPLDAPDQASSASRQHYIDTGRYLTHREVREDARAETKEV